MLIPTAIPVRFAPLRAALWLVLAVLFLNGMLSFDNWWPTPAIWPDARIAAEFIYTWALLMLWVHWVGPLSARALTGLTLIYLILVIGRYVDVSVPALFGRHVNLYWDGQQIPRFLWVTALKSAPWQVGFVVLGVMVLVWGLFRALRASLGILLREGVERARHWRAAWVATAVAVLLGLANLGGWEASWPYISRPVIPTYAHQARLLANAWLPGQAQRVLPPSPAFDSPLHAVAGTDVSILSIESYGAIAFDHPRAGPRLAPSRDALAAQFAAQGLQVVSAYVRAATFGGASELSHLSLLTGVDLSDPMRHDLMLTTSRPTLVSHFRAHRFVTVGLYPALGWDWDERSFYGFERFFDARDLDYQGPSIGYWKLPDQFSLARIDQLVPRAPGAPPRFLFFPSITSHMPFNPVPPYQNDWARILDREPFDPALLDQALARPIDWTDMMPAYLDMIDYNYRWLGGYARQPRARDEVMIIIGDHQPVANVSGPGAPWDVPVHIVSRDKELLQRFESIGFRAGLIPQRPILGGMHDVTQWLLQAFAEPTERNPLRRDASAGVPGRQP